MPRIVLDKPDTTVRSPWSVTVKDDSTGPDGDKYDHHLTDGEMLEVVVAVMKSERPPYIRTKEQWEQHESARQARVDQIHNLKKKPWQKIIGFSLLGAGAIVLSIVTSIVLTY